MKRLAVLVIVLTIVGAACGSSSEDDIQYPAVFIDLDPGVATGTLAPDSSVVDMSPVDRVFDGYVDTDALAASQGLQPPDLVLPSGMYESEWDERGCIVASDTVVVPSEYLTDEGLVPEPPLTLVSAAIGDAELPPEIAGLATVGVPEGFEAVEYVFELIAKGVPAWPHYGAFVQPRWKYGPGTEPVVVEADVIPDVSDVEKSGTVVVIDAFGIDRTTQDGDGKIRTSPESGHGEFVAGIIERMSVNTTRRAVDFYDSSVSSEIAVAELIDEAGIYNLSLGTDQCIVQEGGDLPDGGTLPDDLDGNQIEGELLALPPVVLARQIVGFEATVVAAAGNDSSQDACNRPLYPAGYSDIDTVLADSSDVTVPEILRPYYEGVADFVISVGAVVEPDQGASYPKNRAAFSNCSEISMFAPGVGIISDYPPGGTGLAMWSGTSFATPIVAALLVQKELAFVQAP